MQPTWLLETLVDNSFKRLYVGNSKQQCSACNSLFYSMRLNLLLQVKLLQASGQGKVRKTYSEVRNA